MGTTSKAKTKYVVTIRYGPFDGVWFHRKGETAHPDMLQAQVFTKRDLAEKAASTLKAAAKSIGSRAVVEVEDVSSLRWL